MKQKPRVALLVPDVNAAGWQRFTIEKIITRSDVEVVLLLEIGTNYLNRGRGLLWPILDNMEALISKRLFSGVNHAKGIDYALLARGTLASLVPNAMRLRIEECNLSAPQRSSLKDAQLDVILDLAGTEEVCGLSPFARLGAWTLRDEAGGGMHSHPLGFAAIAANSPKCTVRLEGITGEGDVHRRVLRTGCYSTCLYSWTQNAILLQHQSALMILDALGDLAAERPVAKASNAVASAKNSQIARPGTAAALLNLARCFIRILRMAPSRALMEERWHILLMHEYKSDPEPPPPTILKPPAHSYWADPFAIRKDDRLVVFFEEYLYDEGHGIISCVEVNSDSMGSPPCCLESRPVIKQPYHMSYPFLFRHKNALFMLPETSANKTIEVWRCMDFPYSWKLEKTIFNGLSAVDSTLLFHNELWWLFTNLDRSGMCDPCNELHIFYAHDPLDGEWVPHPGNPVIVDAGCARMAGGFLRAADGALLRCGQVQGEAYGEKVSLSRIETLNVKTYVEQPVWQVGSLAGEVFTKQHHLAHADGVLVADACIYTSKLIRKLSPMGTAGRGELLSMAPRSGLKDPTANAVGKLRPMLLETPAFRLLGTVSPQIDR